jgi:PIN domain nuclease of toxin-antitoxin system
MNNYIMDACALLAVLNKESGAEMCYRLGSEGVVLSKRLV